MKIRRELEKKIIIDFLFKNPNSSTKEVAKCLYSSTYFVRGLLEEMQNNCRVIKTYTSRSFKTPYWKLVKNWGKKIKERNRRLNET